MKRSFNKIETGRGSYFYIYSPLCFKTHQVEHDYLLPLELFRKINIGGFFVNLPI